MNRRGLLVGALWGGLVACRRSAPRRGVDDGTLERYALSGMVIRVDEQSRIVTIKHGPITSAKGELWMEAMTMDFPAASGEDLKKLTRGQSITATVVTRSSDSEYWIENVRP